MYCTYKEFLRHKLCSWSVDTIPLVGEENIAEAVDAVNRLPRVGVLVLAGSLMGGKITETVRKLKENHEDLIVITLNIRVSLSITNS